MRFILFAFLSISSFISSAQSAIIRHNTVIMGNEELFKIYAVGTFTHQSYKVKNLMEEDLILVDQTSLRNDQGTILMKLIFLDMQNAEAYIPMNVNFKKQLARLLANYNVIKNNKLNEQGASLFCKNYSINNYPSKYISPEITLKSDMLSKDKQKPEVKKEEIKKEITDAPEPEVVKEEESENVEAPAEVEDENGIVKRDITQQIYLSGSKIRQDYKEIGSYTSEMKMLLGQEGKQIVIFSLSGNKVAIARFINGDEQCELLTIRDNKTWNIPIPKGDIYVIVKDIVKVLSDRMYM